MNFEIAPKSTEIQSNWDNARMYCFTLNIGGKTGWRLPTTEELNEIWKLENDFENRWYWSSTEFNDTTAWYLCFNHGSQGYYNKNNDYGYVRAIRSTI